MRNWRATYLLIPAALLAGVLGWTLHATADAVKLSDAWIDNVVIQSITDGQVVYITQAGEESRRPLSVVDPTGRLQVLVQGIRADAIPELGVAEKALEAKNPDPAQAANAFQQARAKANQPWLREWIDYRLVRAADDSGQAIAAIDAFLRLARSPKTPSLYLVRVPTASVAAAGERDKALVRQRVKAAIAAIPAAAAEGPIAEALAALLSAAAAQDTGGDGNATASAPSSTSQSSAASSSGQRGPSKVAMPKSVMDDRDVTPLLAAGDFQAAWESADKLARSSTLELDKRLYQRGLARLYLADAAGDRQQYLDAGLDFIRVIVYFPRSRVASAASLEAGYVHAKVGRHDLARKLYGEAQTGIDDEEDPALARRLADLLRELNASENR